MKTSKFKYQVSEKLQSSNTKGLNFGAWRLVFASCAKVVERLCRAGGQAGGLYTISTVSQNLKPGLNIFYPTQSTASAQLYCAFTQALHGIFNLSAVKLYPLSTPTMITTNLIKE